MSGTLLLVIASACFLAGCLVFAKLIERLGLTTAGHSRSVLTF